MTILPAPAVRAVSPASSTPITMPWRPAISPWTSTMTRKRWKEDQQQQRQQQHWHKTAEDYSSSDNTQEEKKGDESAVNRSLRDNQGKSGRTYFKPHILPLSPALVAFQQLHNRGKNHDAPMSSSRSPPRKETTTNPFDSVARSASLCMSAGVLDYQQSLPGRYRSRSPSTATAETTTFIATFRAAPRPPIRCDIFSSEVLKVTWCEKRHAIAAAQTSAVQPPMHGTDIGNDDLVSRLLGALTTSPDVATIDSVLAVDAASTYLRREEDGRLPLHVIGDQRLPIRRNRAAAADHHRNNSNNPPSVLSSSSVIPLIDTLLLDTSIVKQKASPNSTIC
jgi:hypothetical protein